MATFPRQFRAAVGLAIVLLAAGAARLVAADAAAALSPQQIVDQAGLKPMGFLMILPDETDIRAGAETLRRDKQKLFNEAGLRRALNKDMSDSTDRLKQMDQTIQVEGPKINAQPTNEAILAYNSLMAARQQETLHIADVRSQLDKLSSSRADLITHTLDLSDKAEAAAAKYAALAADASVTGALVSLSQPGRTPLKLGPSGLFQEDLLFIRKCRSEIDSATIPVEVQDNVPEVDVRLNDKLTTKMIWDSGATLVTLSYQTAAKIGLVPGDQDQTIQVTLADGRVAKETLMEIDSIRIGTFTVRHIPCEVAPPEAKDSVNLLGDSFQCRFIARMDMANQQVHLTPLGNEPEPGAADKVKSVTAEQP